MINKADFPIKITFHNVPHSQAVEDKARKQAEKLGQFYNKIRSCQVTIETHKHQHKGRIYHVIVSILVPNAELVANRFLEKKHSHENIYVTVRDSFDAMTRQLKAYSHKKHGLVKHHEPTPEGRIMEIAPIADYGYIETLNGQSIRFSSKSVVDSDFNQLEIGDRVSFIEATNHDGTAASTVYVK